MTLKKLAALTNVSVSTASRALNDSCDVAPETRRAVLEAANKYGYFSEKKRIKLENKNHKRLTVAVICPEIVSVHYSLMAECLAHEIEKRGSRCIIYSFGFDRDLFRDTVIKCINDTACDALICFSAIHFEVPETSIPVIHCGLSGGFSYMHYDFTPALTELVDSLTASGRRRIAYAGESLTEQKRDLLSSCLEARGMMLYAQYSNTERFEEAGEAAAKYFLSLDVLPDAVVCAYDEIAFGLIHVLNMHGVKVPEDVSVTGINDIPSAHCFAGGLSTVRYDFDPVAKRIVDDIFAQKNGIESYIIPSKFIKRST